MEIIYIQLLNEGSIAYRPVFAKKINDSVYEIIDHEYDSEDEEWEFLPGTIVLVKEQVLSEEKVLVAVKEYIRKL